MVNSPGRPGADLRARGILDDVDLTDDPLIAHSEKLVRVGGVIPPLATIPTLFVLRAMSGGPGELAVCVGAFAILGQVLVWTGMRGLHRAEGWASGVFFHLFLGGVLSSLTLFLTRIPVLMPIPLMAPLVGGFAKRRLQRRTRSGAPR